ncbi:MAG: hypothetical protein PWQ09_398 [Candidatus Cloacimonadota bacterium]|jgi:Tfp pilus assembly protein PilF|nr:hypothetical protein [Candidatus Cloacimonadota bacterium]
MKLKNWQGSLAALFIVLLISGCGWLGQNSASKLPKPSSKSANLKSVHYYSLAETAIQNQNLGLAEKLLDKAITSDEKTIYLKQRQIEILSYLAQKDSTYQKKLTTLAHNYYKKGQYNAEILFDLARFYASQKSIEKADKYFREAIEMQPDMQKILIYYLFQMQNKPEADEKLLQQAEEQPWENAKFALILGELYFRIDEEKGIQILEKAHEKWDNEETFEKLIVFSSRLYPSQHIIQLIEDRLAADKAVSTSLQQYFIELNFREQNFAKIVQHKQLCYELDTQQILRYLFFAAVELGKHELAAETGEYIAQNKELEPEQQDSFYQYVAQQFFQLANYTKTAYYLNQIKEPLIIIYFFNEQMMMQATDVEILALLEELQKFDTNKTNFVLANIYATLEQKELSQKFLAQVDDDFIEKNKLFSVAALTYLINSENTEKAYQLFSQAGNINANEEIALYLRSQGKQDKAFKFMQKAQQDSLQAVSYIFLADYYEQEAKIDSALQALQTAASLYPADADILNYYGYFIANQEISRLYPKAEKLLQKAVELQPDSHYIWDSLAWLYVKQKRYSEAQKAFDKVQNATINSSEEAYHLGYFYWKTENLEKASYFLKMAINLNNETDYVKKSEELLLKILAKDEK